MDFGKLSTIVLMESSTFVLPELIAISSSSCHDEVVPKEGEDDKTTERRKLDILFFFVV